MDYSKNWYQSLTINAALLGSVGTVVVMIARFLNIEVAEEEVTTAITAFLTVVAFVMTIYGRMRANTKIKE